MVHSNSTNINFEESIKTVKKNNIIYELNKAAYNAVKTNNLVLFKELIQKGSNLHSLQKSSIHPFNNNDDGPLHVAVRNNNIEITKYLLSLENTIVDAKNRKDETPFFFAVDNGNYEILDLLLQAGADIEARDDYEDTPICWAAYIGNLEMMKFLVSKNAKVNMTNRDKNTVLHWACYKGETEIVKYLITEHKLDYNQENIHGETPLVSAIDNGRVETVFYLIHLEKISAKMTSF